MILLESRYELGQEVYLKTDKEQDKRIVKQICFNNKGCEYHLVCGTTGSWHADFEIASEVDVLMKTTGNAK